MATHRTSYWLLPLALGLACLAGCGRDQYPENLRYEFRPYPSRNAQNELEVFNVDAEIKQQLGEQLLDYFGTPRDPLVTVSDDLINNPELQFDPETLQEGSKLYRRFCLHCHGLVGDGNGPTGAFLNPKPRDFRQGVFKFRSTVRIDATSKKPDTSAIVTPSRSDLLKTIKQGIPTAAMPAFNLLNEEEELNPIISYVIHLSLRGQVERLLAQTPDMEDLGAEVERAAETWVYTGRKGRYEKMAFPFPKPPADWGKMDTTAIHSRMEKGRNLFVDRGGCKECHGPDGRSNPVEIPTNPGRRNDWGDLNPPRNLTFGYFRGGSRPADLYYRFRLGIAGSGMPAASDKVTDEEVWYLVDFVLNLPQQQR